MFSYYKLASFVISFLLVVGCAGTKTFPNVGRVGDTVSIAAGWKHFSRDNITVTITTAVGADVVYPTGSSAIRSVVNFYADPLCSMIVSAEKGFDVTPYARTYSGQIETNFTKGDKDFWQTVVFIDLPATLATGPATVDIVSAQGETVTTLWDVIAGEGAPERFIPEAYNGPLSLDHLTSLERLDHYEVTFSGSVVPYAIQIDLS